MTGMGLQALGKLKCTRRVLLSGTPVQNNLDEVSTISTQIPLTQHMLPTAMGKLWLSFQNLLANALSICSRVISRKRGAVCVLTCSMLM